MALSTPYFPSFNLRIESLVIESRFWLMTVAPLMRFNLRIESLVIESFYHSA